MTVELPKPCPPDRRRGTASAQPRKPANALLSCRAPGCGQIPLPRVIEKLLAVAVTSAALDDGSHAWQVLRKLLPADYPRPRLLWADSKYQNHSLQAWLKQQQATYEIEVVSRPIGAKGFVLLHHRWVVERSIAWLNRYRRLSKEYDYYAASSEA
jgi:transposase